ncbi:MAG: hypothetical protein NTV86_11155 [Planctomycetota bacterium]|nr:hypothetical protein [Planctomycetota bacterium]
MTRSILIVAALTGVLAGSAGGGLTGSMPVYDGFSKEMTDAWNATVTLMAKYLYPQTGRGEVQQAGDDCLTGKTSGTAEVQGKCDALLAEFDAGCLALMRAYQKAEGTITVNKNGSTTGYVEDKRGIGEWSRNQRAVIEGIAGWYVPYVEWRRMMFIYMQNLYNTTESTPKKFEELHKQMAQADKVLADARANCKVGSESQIKQYIRHVAKVRPIVSNVQSYVLMLREAHALFLANDKRQPDTLEKQGMAAIQPARAVHASPLTFNILEKFHEPGHYEKLIASDCLNYGQRLDACRKAVEPLTKGTLFDDLEAFKGVKLDGLLKAADEVDAHCKKVLEEHRRKYNPEGHKAGSEGT